MNAKKDNIDTMLDSLKELFIIDNEEEKIELKASIIQLDILHEVSELMKKSKDVSNRTELAKRLGKSKGFISQLFSGDKALNLKMIAQLQEIFDVKFLPSFKDNNYYRIKNMTMQNYSDNNEYKRNKTPIYQFPNGEEIEAMVA